MKSIVSSVMSGRGAVATALAVTVALQSGSGAMADAPTDLVKRGEYLARAGDCISCHTAASAPYGSIGGDAQGVAYAGGLVVSTPFGDLISPNITPDVETGVGGWTADDFWRTMHFGINKRGQPLYPAMPYVFYTKVTRDDSDAIFAYLKSLKPVRHAVDVNQLHWPYDMRFAAMTAWQTLWFTPGVYQPDPGKTPEWNRGAYLVGGLGHCSACHTPRNFMGAVETSERFTGASLDNWFAPNITPNRRFGIGGYTAGQLTEFFRNGVMTRTVEQFGKEGAGQATTEPLPTAVGPMAEVWHNSLRFLTDADARAMAAYLESLPAETSPLRESAAAPRPARLSAGARLYIENCAVCHVQNGSGAQGLAPPLAANPMVVAPSPNDLLSMIIGGQGAQHQMMMMPGFGSQLSNADAAALATYVRTAWDNKASPVTADQVAELRRAFTPARGAKP
jgi:mono/diheme cytochrome c family protein